MMIMMEQRQGVADYIGLVTFIVQKRKYLLSVYSSKIMLLFKESEKLPRR